MNKKVIEKVIKEFESEVDSRYINIISRFDYKVIELLVNAVEKNYEKRCFISNL